MRTVEFAVDSNEIELIPLADWHIGSPQADLELIKETCDYVKTHKNAYVVLLGDIVDHVTTNSVGSVFEQTMTTKDQVVTATFFLRDIVKQGKVVAMLAGNHELRPTGDGLSPADLLLAKLMNYDESLNDRYCEDGAYIFLTLNGRTVKTNSKVCVTIFALHGAGGGSRIGGKIQRLHNMRDVIPANIYLHAHTHQPETHKGIFYDVNTNNHTVREQPCLYCNCGSMLKYGGYGARKGFEPLSRAIPVIKIKATRTERHAKERLGKTIECVLKEHLED